MTRISIVLLAISLLPIASCAATSPATQPTADRDSSPSSVAAVDVRLVALSRNRTGRRTVSFEVAVRNNGPDFLDVSEQVGREWRVTDQRDRSTTLMDHDPIAYERHLIASARRATTQPTPFVSPSASLNTRQSDRRPFADPSGPTSQNAPRPIPCRATLVIECTVDDVLLWSEAAGRGGRVGGSVGFRLLPPGDEFKIPTELALDQFATQRDIRAYILLRANGHELARSEPVPLGPP